MKAAGLRKNIIMEGKGYIFEGCNREKFYGHKSSEKKKGQEGKVKEKNTEMIEERHIDDGTSSDIEILEIDEVIKRGLSHLLPDHIAHVNVNKEVKEGKGNEKISTEMTDRKNNSDEVIKQGISSVFVPAKTCISLSDSDASDGMPASDYRGRVLEILKKPFDKKEYRELSEEMKFYLVYYRDLRKKLVKHRYEKPERINLMRGFFYWLKSETCAGAFKPWQDSECLAVSPDAGQEN